MAGERDAGGTETIAEAVTILSLHRIEALVIVADAVSVVPGEGVVLAARLSQSLLVTLFVPDSLNHLCKGAVVVRDGIVERAAVPVSRSAGWEWLGKLAQEGGAIVVSVSEADGVVRVAVPGREGVKTVEPSTLAQHIAETFRGLEERKEALT